MSKNLLEFQVDRIPHLQQLSVRRSTIFEGDALTVLRLIPSGSVRCIVTSPPYWGLRDYKITGQIGLETTIDQFINRLVGVFSEAKRVLSDDGTLWLNMGDGYTSGGRPSSAPDKRYQGRTVNVRLNTPEGLKPKDLIGTPWRLAFALQSNGWYLRSDIIWHKPNAQPESVKDRPTRSHEYLFMFSKSEKYYYDWRIMREKANNGGTRNRRSVWNVNTKPFLGAHFATFPQELIRPCILASSSVGDYVLDPFFGSGTVGLVCKNDGREFIGIEINPEYIELAKNRVKEGVGEVIRIESA